MLSFQNVINTFTSTAKNARCQFVGNVTVGRDISLQDLRNHYTAVVLVTSYYHLFLLSIAYTTISGLIEYLNATGLWI